MAWSKSLNNKFAKIQPKEEEKKQESSFYDNYKARSGSNNNDVSFTPSLKAKTGGSAGSAASSKQSGGGTVSSKKAAPTTVLGNNTKYFSGFQSYQDRKKTGNVFTPSPVLGKYGSGFNFGTTLKLKAENNKRKQERERPERGVYHPNTRITSGDDAIAMKMPSKVKMYGNDAALGLQNVYHSILQTADILRWSHYLRELAKQYIDDNKLLKSAGIAIDMADPTGAAISNLKEIYGRYANASQQRADEMHYMTPGKTDDYIGKGVETMAEMLPHLLVSIATGGASTGGQFAEYGEKSIGNIISDKVISNPSAWYEFAKNAGPAYERAKKNGANEAQALSSGVQNGMFNVITEMGGGFEGSKPVEKGFLNSGKRAVKSKLKEGAENIFYGAGEKFIEKSIYDYDKPWFSISDDDAVINPQRALNEAAAGMFSSMVMDGARQRGHMGEQAVKRAYDAYNDGIRFVPRINKPPEFRMR